MVRNICAVCNEEISQRTCPLCMTDEVELWLERKRISFVKDFRTEVRQFLDRTKHYNRMTCNICRAETETAVCRACFTERIVAWFAKKDKVLATDFVRAFKSDLQDEKELYA
ncbi:MAG: hypothetical protein V1839_03385 [archaeon]